MKKTSRMTRKPNANFPNARSLNECEQLSWLVGSGRSTLSFGDAFS